MFTSRPQKQNLHSMKNIPFAFFGTPNVASKTLDILFSSGYVPRVIITSPDARSGRGMHLSPTEVSIWATEHSIECLKPEKITPEFIEEFKKFNVDLSIVVAYGKILPEVLINTPLYGTINIHYSLLPKYRGASPLEQALLNGDTVTGVTIQQMEFKLDTGAILASEEVAIDIHEDKETIRAKLIRLGAQKLCDILPTIVKGTLTPSIQDEAQATYCTKHKKEDGEIDLHGDGKENYNKYRAFKGWPGTFFFKDGKRIKITKAKYENDSFVIERVIPEGKKEIDYALFNTSK